MSERDIEFRVAATLGGEPFDGRDEWERFRSVDEAKRYMELLARFGLGAVLYAVPLNAGAPVTTTLTLIDRVESAARARVG